MSQLLVRTWQLLSQNRILLAPVLFETLIILLFTGGGGMMDSNPISSLALFFLHQALLGGWLYQMKIVLLERSKPASWDDFFEGVARYFWPLLAGSSMFFLILIMLLSLCSMIAEAWLGPLDTRFLEKLLPLLQGGETAQIEALFKQNEAAVQLMLQWAGVFAVGLAILAVVAILTSFWQQYVVLSGMSWLNAWKNSKNLIFRHLGALSLLGLFWLLPTLLLQILMMSRQPLLSILALTGDILAKAYFTLLFSHALLQLDREQVTPLPPGEVP